MRLGSYSALVVHTSQMRWRPNRDSLYRLQREGDHKHAVRSIDRAQTAGGGLIRSRQRSSRLTKLMSRWGWCNRDGASVPNRCSNFFRLHGHDGGTAKSLSPDHRTHFRNTLNLPARSSMSTAQHEVDAFLLKDSGGHSGSVPLNIELSQGRDLKPWDIASSASKNRALAFRIARFPHRWAGYS